MIVERFRGRRRRGGETKRLGQGGSYNKNSHDRQKIVQLLSSGGHRMSTIEI